MVTHIDPGLPKRLPCARFVVRRARRGEVDSCLSYTLRAATGDGFNWSGLLATNVLLQ